MHNPSIYILIHIYYEDTLISIYKKVRTLLTEYRAGIIVNISAENPSYDKLCRVIRKKLPLAVIIRSSNKGKDVGGKLMLLYAYLKLGIKADVLLLLHDKKSPQLIDGDRWSSSLFDIVKRENIEKSLKLLEDKNVGMVGRKEEIISKHNKTEEEIFVGGRELMLQLAKSYDINPKDYTFIGGTMFWVKSEIYEHFFSKYSPLSIRACLEEGNVMDDFGPTYTHSWERMFGWIISTYNKHIKGI